MTGKTHQILGITSSAAYYLFSVPSEYTPATLGAVIAISYVGALLPDIDQPAAKLWDSFPFGHLAGHVVDPFLEHRNISHSILGTALITTGVWYIVNLAPEYWGINKSIAVSAFTISYISHLVADMITSEGIPLLFPLKNMMGFPPRPFQGVRILTGKWFENLIIFPIINMVLVLMIVMNWDKIKVILFK